MSLQQYISNVLPAIGKSKQRLVAVLQVFTVAAIVALTLVDVERDLGGELWLSRAVPVVMAVGAVACLVAGRGVRPTALDAVVAVWWTAEAALCYAGCGVFAPGAFWAFSESVFLYFALRLLFSAGRQSGAWVAVLIMAGCLYESALGIYQLIADTSRHGLFPMTGTFLNPGPYSAYLAVGVAMALCKETGNGRRETGDGRQTYVSCHKHSAQPVLPFYPFTFLPLITVLFTFLPLIVAWSRAAWVAVAVVAACVYWRQLARYKYVVLALAVVGGVAAYLLKQGSADGRVVMWLGALKAIAADPWTGAGIGGFGGAYAEGVAALFADGGAQGLLQSANVTDNAYNELLTIGVEQGLPGMVAFAAVVVMALLRLRRSCRPLMYGLLALVVFSMFSYPLHCQPYRILFVLMCAWGAAAPAPAPSNSPMRGRIPSGSEAPSNSPVRGRIPSGSGTPSNSPVRGRIPSGSEAPSNSPMRGRALSGRGAFYAFVFVLVLASLVARADMERRVAASEDYRLMAGVDASYMIDDYYELLPLMGDNERFLFDFGKALAGLGRHNDSNAMLRWGAQLSADPMFTVLMGNNYRAMGMPAEAERCYRSAFSIMPNRIYPLYRLMKLYEE